MVNNNKIILSSFIIICLSLRNGKIVSLYFAVQYGLDSNGRVHVPIDALQFLGPNDTCEPLKQNWSW